VIFSANNIEINNFSLNLIYLLRLIITMGDLVITCNICSSGRGEYNYHTSKDPTWSITQCSHWKFSLDSQVSSCCFTAHKTIVTIKATCKRSGCKTSCFPAKTIAYSGTFSKSASDTKVKKVECSRCKNL
jgi:hypothetical protein